MKKQSKKTTATPVTGISIAEVTPKPVKGAVLSAPKPTGKQSKSASVPVAKPDPSLGPVTEERKLAAEQAKAERVTSKPTSKKSGSAKSSAAKSTAKTTKEPSNLQKVLATAAGVRPSIPEPKHKADGTPDWGGSCYYMGLLVRAGIPLKEALTDYYFKAYPFGGAPKAVALYHNWEKRIAKGLAKAEAKAAAKTSKTAKNASKSKSSAKPSKGVKSAKSATPALATEPVAKAA